MKDPRTPLKRFLPLALLLFLAGLMPMTAQAQSTDDQAQATTSGDTQAAEGTDENKKKKKPQEEEEEPDCE